MKTVLIITYYWPPAGGIEVHRVVKFCKYLKEFGYSPHVLTVRNSTATATDPELCNEVAHVDPVTYTSSWEPHHLFYKLTGKSTAVSQPQHPTSGSSKTNFLAEFIRLNVFIPDARIGWLPGGIKEGLQAIKENPPELIFSTAPPYTVHLIAKRIARKLQIPWIADFRDPWVENYAYNTQYRFPWVRWLNERMERSVLNTADRVVVATPGQETLQSGKARDGRARFLTLTNGHDFDRIPTPIPADKFRLAYYGSMSMQRIPKVLFRTLRNLIAINPAFANDFQFRVAGRLTPDAGSYIASALPEHHLEILPMLPHHEYRQKVVEHQLLLVLVDQVPHNDMILPAKCLEMITTGNPMLAFGPPGGNVDTFLKEKNCGTLVHYENETGIENILLDAWQKWKAGTLNQGSRAEPDLHRKELTRKLSELFTEILT